MNKRILLVDDVPQTLQVLARMLADEFQVETAVDTQSALARVEAEGPYAVVVSDYDLPDGKGSELLARVGERSPETVPVLLTGMVDLDVAIEALHKSRIFRFLEKPCPRDTLREALRDALREHGERHARSETERRLDFTAKVLERFNGELDERLNRQSASLAELQRLAGELSGAGSLQAIARLTAEACSAACPQRGALVELWVDSGEAAGERVRAAARQAPGERRHMRPIESAEGQIGMLAVDSFDAAGRRLSREERGVLAAIASTCAVAVHNETRRQERDEAQHAAMLALAKLAEQRDNETGRHLERVSLYCRLIAEGVRELPDLGARIDERFVRDLSRSAPLHDIGKVGIPDSILLKPGKLDRAEWEVMKTHTTIGAETLDSVISRHRRNTFLEMSRDIAWCHHERWDGSGYPRGLCAEAIPLAARILTVADVYDALTSVRPYKDAWPHADALAALAEGSGSQFDPRLVAAFIERAAEVDAIRGRLADEPGAVLPARARQVRQPG